MHFVTVEVGQDDDIGFQYTNTTNINDVRHRSVFNSALPREAVSTAQELITLNRDSNSVRGGSLSLNRQQQRLSKGQAAVHNFVLRTPPALRNIALCLFIHSVVRYDNIDSSASERTADNT